MSADDHYRRQAEGPKAEFYRQVTAMETVIRSEGNLPHEILDVYKEGQNIELSADQEANPEKIVFFSPSLGFLRYTGKEPEINNTLSIYNYSNPANRNIKLSIFLNRKDSSHSRVGITILTKP